VEHPIAAWTGPGSRAADYFRYADGGLEFRSPVPEHELPILRDWIEELVDWRLAEYLQRSRRHRIYRLRDMEGNQIDASFMLEEVEGELSVYLESRGGTKGTPAARNTRYSEGLALLLRRLQAQGAILESVRLVTRKETRDLALSIPFPVHLSKPSDLDLLRSEIQWAQGNNSTRRIQLVVSAKHSVSAQEWARFLMAGDGS